MFQGSISASIIYKYTMLERPIRKLGNLADKFGDSPLLIKKRNEDSECFHEVLNVGTRRPCVNFRRENRMHMKHLYLSHQHLILRGMVEGKTNHELATELGFSVSTIRHETMRIYQALSVSDRKEAAKKALMLSLV